MSLVDTYVVRVNYNYMGSFLEASFRDSLMGYYRLLQLHLLLPLRSGGMGGCGKGIFLIIILYQQSWFKQFVDALRKHRLD